MEHSVDHGHHGSEDEWAAMAAQIELEGEVMLPYVTEVASWVAEMCRRDGFEVRRVLDVGSGPGVGTCELARCFPSAAVVAVDGSSAMLEKVAARVKALGLSTRVATRLADLSDGLDGLGRADLMWAAMVLHHIGDEVAALRAFRGTLNPGGFLVVVEHGDPLRFLPADADAELGRPGLTERLDAAWTAWLAAMRESLPHATPSSDYPTMLAAAGCELVADRVVHVQLAAPLETRARQMLLGRLRRTRQLYGERLDEQDYDALAVLTDENHPLGIMRRADAFLDASRHIYVGRTP
jgi:SAM-dependent methyltransferase